VSRAWRTLAAGGLVWVGVNLWMRRHPSAFPYWMRFLLDAPRGRLSSGRLLEILAPQPGERILELGPGTGHYSLDVAAALDGGSLDIFDIQEEFLDHVMRRAGERGLANLKPTVGDAQSLPYEDGSFDAAFLVSVLGEVPDQDAALRELARVLRPGGRLVVGESALAGDPHVVLPGSLQRRTASAGFELERRLGGPLSYLARFRRAR
jgi:SAM-dependent methyltransferase